jgi:ABC-2 type transport system ATP-binding protein
LLDTEAVQSIRFTDEGEGLVLATRSPATVYSQLPEWIADTDVRIDEFRAADESLHALFDSLLRIHRGRS